MPTISKPNSATPDKKRLASVQEQLAALRTQRAEKKGLAERARDAFAADGALDTTSPEFIRAREAATELVQAEGEINALQNEQITLLQRIAGTGGTPSDADALRSLAPPGFGDASWATGELLSDPEMRERLTEISSTSMAVGRFRLGQVADRETIATSFRGDAMAADITGTPDMRRGTYLGVVPQLTRQLRVLDILPFGTCDGNTVPYTQESGSFNAGETSEGATKPEDGAVYTDKTAIVQTIAAWQKVRKQSLADFATLQSMIDNRLRYSCSLRLENQVVGGDGVDPNILGILNTSGIGSVAFSSSVPQAELILRGIVNVFLANGAANGILVNPLDWQASLTQKSTYTASAGVTGGSGEYYGGGPFQITPQVMWGVPVIPSAAIAQGTALVGDFARGAQVLIREGISVLISDSDQNDFIQNRVTLLGEMRAAVPVFQPTLFNKIALA